MFHRSIAKMVAVFVLILVNSVALGAGKTDYHVNPGDLLEISVWNEAEMNRELRVMPDGSISFPLAGYINVSGKSVRQIQEEIKSKLRKFISDPEVNVAIKSVDGNVVYVIGQVKNPGQFIMYNPMDVMQTLSLAGGLTAFAQENNIIILRRTAKGSVSIEFEYSEVEDGDELDTNYLMQSGDVIVVP